MRALFLFGLAICAACAARAETAAGLYVDCRGARSAAPTVILESGAFGTSADWDLVERDLARSGRVCAYDRAGVGASPPAAGARDAIAIANGLAAMLDALGEAGPVILVGHSNGALYAEAFAALWPARVAGLVYVNGVTSNAGDNPRLLGDLAHEKRLADLAVLAARLGLAPVAAGALAENSGLPPEARRRKRTALSRLRRLKVARDEDRAMAGGLTAVAGLGGAPAAVPTASVISLPPRPSPLERAWAEAEAAPARRAARGWVLTAVGATHVSPLTRDRAWTEAAVDWLRGQAPAR